MCNISALREGLTCSHSFRESLSEVIINDLGNYRHKRVLGLAAMFGDQMVTSEFAAHLPFTNFGFFVFILLSTLYHFLLAQITCLSPSSWRWQRPC